MGTFEIRVCFYLGNVDDELTEPRVDSGLFLEAVSDGFADGS